MLLHNNKILLPKLTLTFDNISKVLSGEDNNTADQQHHKIMTSSPTNNNLLDPQILNVWKDVQTMINKQIHSLDDSNKDTMDIDDDYKADGDRDNGFHRIQMFLQKIQKDQDEEEIKTMIMITVSEELRLRVRLHQKYYNLFPKT